MSSVPGDLTTNQNAGVYYSRRYWNDLALVRAYMNRRISGDPGLQPERHFALRYGRVFHDALMLNCGNGWVERDFFDQGLIERAVGVDYSSDLLDTARRAADELSLPVTYVQMDTNAAEFPEGEYDLVVNWAAGHHIAFLDRVFRELCRIMPEDGLLLSFDYVGPHRNQYTAQAWEAVWEANRALPSGFRQQLAYPHLPTMLQTDPTEAIHSELVVEVFRRYFQVEELVPLGGAVAYPLLTFNDGLFAADNERERDKWVQYILDADDRFLRQHPDSSLFAYFVGTPNKAVLENGPQLEQWRREEREREAAGAARGGRYYPRTAIQAMNEEIEELRRELSQSRARVVQLEGERDRLTGSVPYRLMRKILQSRLWRRASTTRWGRRAVERLRKAVAARV